MGDQKNWFELIDHYFDWETEWLSGDTTTFAQRPFDPDQIIEAPSEALVYYIKKLIWQKITHKTRKDANHLIDFVPEALLSDIVETIVTVLEEVADFEKVDHDVYDALHRISQQNAEAVHPYLHRLFELILIHGRYFLYHVESVWRGASQLEHYFEVLRDIDQQTESRISAWRCLAETHNPNVIREALPELVDERLQYKGYEIERDITYLGFDWNGNELRPLYQEAGYHLIFPREYISTHEHERNLEHQTHNLDTTDAVRLPFGGQLTNCCWRCRKPLHHLLTLTFELTKSLSIHSRKNVEFATCFSCTVPELYYQHDESGKVSSLPHGRRVVNFTGKVITGNPHSILFNAIGTGRYRTWGKDHKRWKLLNWKSAGLIPTEVAIVSTPTRWRWQSYDYHQNLHRLGGHATWVQDYQYLTCPQCGKKMAFVMQIKDQLPLANGKEQFYGDSGIGYFYWCDDCAVSGFQPQFL